MAAAQFLSLTDVKSAAENKNSHETWVISAKSGKTAQIALF